MTARAPGHTRVRGYLMSKGEREASAIEVQARDRGCIAARLDPEHRCMGRLTLAHVPERGKNALGRKPPFDRYHLVVECLGANSGGTRPWSEMHREIEREYLAGQYPGHYEEGT